MTNSAAPTISPVPSPTLIISIEDTPPSSSATEPINTPEIIPDSGWELIHTGLERRIINLTNTEGAFREKLYLMRIDPNLYRFDIGYHPGSPQSMTDWQKETGALVLLNGGFFTEANLATGLIVVKGQPSGLSYEDFGGMFVITSDGPELRWLPEQPYNSSEMFLAGLQSYPMLVTPGGQIGYPDEDGVPARRTVIAQDRDGRIIFLLGTTGTLTLHELSRYLVESDLNLQMALNLDGGGSTGLLLADPVGGVAPYTLLPSVITVYVK